MIKINVIPKQNLDNISNFYQQAFKQNKLDLENLKKIKIECLKDKNSKKFYFDFEKKLKTVYKFK